MKAHTAVRLAWPLGLAALLTACSAEPVTRKVMLMPEGKLPQGMVLLTADTLLVQMQEVEPLEDTFRHIAWASTDTSPIALGEIHSGEMLGVPFADLMVPIADVHEVTVTVESAAGPLPASPTTAAAMHSEVPGSLTIDDVSAEAMAAAMAQATIADESLEMSSTGLPALPPAYLYGVWLAFPEGEPAAGDGHGDTHALSGDHGGSGGAGGAALGMVWMGQLDPQGGLSTRLDRVLALAHGLSVTIEAVQGHEMMSPTTVLSGEIMLPENQGGDEHGAHMH